jgi:hypothetical protein
MRMKYRASLMLVVRLFKYVGMAFVVLLPHNTLAKYSNRLDLNFYQELDIAVEMGHLLLD